MQNPKLAGSNLIDCIPQTGLCPNNCLACYYNSDGFYRTKDSPLIPTLEEAQGKIVRVNSGHDSNIAADKDLEKDLVLSVTAQYPHCRRKVSSTLRTTKEYPEYLLSDKTSIQGRNRSSLR